MANVSHSPTNRSTQMASKMTSKMTPAAAASSNISRSLQQAAQASEALAEALEATARAETLSQIEAIRGTRHFRAYKISLCVIAVLLAVFYLVVIDFFNFVGLLEENSVSGFSAVAVFCFVFYFTLTFRFFCRKLSFSSSSPRSSRCSTSSASLR